MPGFHIYQGTGTGTLLATVTNTDTAAIGSATIQGLTNGTPYTFTVRAFNTAGESTASNSVTVTPTAVVSPPPPPPPPGLTRFRAGSWYETPLPAAAPVHGSSATWITELMGAPGGVTYLTLSGGKDHPFGTVNDTSIPIYRVDASTPNYHLVPNTAGAGVTWLDPRFAAGGEGIRIPATAKTWFTTTVTTGAMQFVIFDPARGYYAYLANLNWEAGGTPVAGDTDVTGRWLLGTGATATTGLTGVSMLSSYGIGSNTTDPTTIATPAFWPAHVRTDAGPGTGPAPATYQDNPENYGFRDINMMAKVIDFDRQVAENGLSYVAEMSAWRTAATARFPLSGSQDLGGVIPEGARLRIKPSVNVSARLAADTTLYGNPAARTSAQTAAYTQAVRIATGMQTYGLIVGSRSTSANMVRLEGRGKEGKPVGWQITENGLQSIPFSDWEFIADDYVPGVTVSPPPPPPPGTVPSAPPSLVVLTVDNGQVMLDWTESTAPAADPVSTYIVYQGTGTGTPLATTGATQTSDNVVGLTNGTTYTFTVRAANSSGVSAASPSVTANPGPRPDGSPGAFAKTSATDTTISMSWTAVADAATAPTLGYRVYSAASGTLLLDTASLTGTVTGLRAGGTYQFYVVAYNRVGEGPRTPTVTMTTTGISPPPPPVSPPPPPGSFPMWETDTLIPQAGPTPTAPTNVQAGSA